MLLLPPPLFVVVLPRRRLVVGRLCTVLIAELASAVSCEPHVSALLHGRYPKFVVDFQLQERQRIAAEEAALQSRRRLAEELAKRK
jgi:hypothetical protein